MSEKELREALVSETLVSRVKAALAATAYRGAFVGHRGAFVEHLWDDEIAQRLLDRLAEDHLVVAAAVPEPALNVEDGEIEAAVLVCLNCDGTGYYVLDGAHRPCLWDHRPYASLSDPSNG